VDRSRTLIRLALDLTLEDGFYYEHFQYAVFSLHWIQRFLDALECRTGEDLYPLYRVKLEKLKFYFIHSILPDGRGSFDFGDNGRGAAERRSRLRPALRTGYETLYRLAAKYRDEQMQGVARWLHQDLKSETWEPFWAWWGRDDSLPAAPVASLGNAHWFRDHGTYFWRSAWTKDATAIAFRAAPPHGHAAVALLRKHPTWRLSTGHAHPDANSFIFVSRGAYLSGDTGYTGVKRTSDHNTVLIDGQGQRNDGRHEVFKDVPYDELNRIRLEAAETAAGGVYARGSAAAAYPPELGVKKFARHVLLLEGDSALLVVDEIETAAPRRVTWHFQLDRPDALAIQSAGTPVTVGETEALTVTARGRPGSVERGPAERRGARYTAATVQAQTRSTVAHLLHAGSGLTLAPSGAAFLVRRASGAEWRIELKDGRLNWTAPPQ
jgi:hypothetical protein